MKALHQAGANFLRKWEGKPPSGRTMTDLKEHRGQVNEPRINRFDVTLTKQGMTKVWRF